MDKKLYKYETNIKYNNGIMVALVGNNKKELEQHFKDLGVKIGKKTNTSIFIFASSHNYLEGQKELLIKYLKLKKVYIEKEGNK